MENNTVMRSSVADFLHCKDMASGEEGFFLMGVGFTSLNENSNAQAEKRAYISDKVASTIIRAYETQFPFATDLMTKQPVIDRIYNVSRNQLRGAAAEADYVRVEAFIHTSIPDIHPARRFRTAIEVADITGEGTQHMEMSGNLNPVGDFTPGVFDILSKVFYEGRADEDGVLTVDVNGTALRLAESLFDVTGPDAHQPGAPDGYGG